MVLNIKKLPDISSKQMNAVLAVAELRSFVAAASYLQISQPALSRTIQRVEDILGLQIFQRTTKIVEVTQAGQEFVETLKRIGHDLEATIDHIQQSVHQRRGHISMSSIISLGNNLVPRAIALFQQSNPDMTFYLRDGMHDDVVQDVKTGVSDFGLTYLSDLPETFDTLPFGTTSFRVVAGKQMQAAHEFTNPVDPNDLIGKPFVSLPKEAQTRRMLDTLATTLGVRFTHKVIVSQFPALLNLVRQGIGIGLVSTISLNPDYQKQLCQFELRETEFAPYIGIIFMKDRPLSLGSLAFVEEMLSAWQNINAKNA